MEATCILCDNQSCIKLSENPMFHDKSKHIEIRYHYIRDMVQKGAVRLQYVAIDEQFGCADKVVVKDEVRVLQGQARRSPSSEGVMASYVITG
jgi:uncharacterized protein (DUF488 family)